MSLWITAVSYTHLDVYKRQELGGRGKKVTMDTVDQLIDASLEFAQPEVYALMHSTPIEFDTVAGPRPEVPVGQAAPYLSGPVSHVYVQEELKSLISAALDKVGLDADMYIGAPLSSGLFVIPPAAVSYTHLLYDGGGDLAKHFQGHPIGLRSAIGLHKLHSPA